MDDMPKLKRTALQVLCVSFFAGFAATAVPTPSHASDDLDPVYVFNRICYSQVPKLDRIRDMARQVCGGDTRAHFGLHESSQRWRRDSIAR